MVDEDSCLHHHPLPKKAKAAKETRTTTKDEQAWDDIEEEKKKKQWLTKPVKIITYKNNPYVDDDNMSNLDSFVFTPTQNLKERRGAAMAA